MTKFEVGVIVGAALLWGEVASANPGLAVQCDFDGNGDADLAIGSPSEAIGSASGAGAVTVLLGSASGVTTSFSAAFQQGGSGMAGASEAGDAFGSALACGDFNNDGFDDLAIGVPDEDVGAVANAGAVSVIHGSPFGLHATLVPNQLWHLDNFSAEAAASGDRFGWALAAGDFNGDGVDDLAVGIPGDNVVDGTDTFGKAGAVSVLFGTQSVGLTGANTVRLTQGLFGSPNDWERFGSTLASGDFDDDGYDDIVVGTPRQTVDGIAYAGVVQVFRGWALGVTALGGTELDQGDLPSAVAEDELFGSSLAVGDFDGDGYADLAVGAPEGTVGGSAAGEVNVVYGGPSGLVATGSQLWTQDTGSVEGFAEPGDRFGYALAVGDFDGDGRDDLAVGAPGEAIGSTRAAGLVNVLMGTASGLSDTGDTYWYQGFASVFESAETGDVFGHTLATGDFNGDGHDDLAIGAPGESLAADAEGVVHVLYGTTTTVSASGQDCWSQGVTGVPGASEAHDRMGGANASTGVYRLPYADGTTVNVSVDPYNHRLRTDLTGSGGSGPYTVVAAADGIVREIEDNLSPGDEGNSYVWIEHANGEWTKYSHLADGSTAHLQLNQQISAGDMVGIEGDVGAETVHLHFNVSVPDDPANPIGPRGYIDGDHRIPRFCDIPGGALVRGESYTADGC